MGLSAKGIRFGADQRSLTRIVFFVAIPTAASAFYLKLLAGLTKTFQEDAAREKLLEAGSQEKLWKTLCQLTRRAIP
jgi:mannitol/fructose-specific phosphotransferase system IIA component (Ntr-type)